MFLAAGLAETMKGDAGKPYRPLDKEEWGLFNMTFCVHCECLPGCEILTRALAHNVNHPNYPAEWTIGDDGQPECLRFTHAGQDQ